MKNNLNQSNLWNVVHKLFPGENIITNSRKESNISNSHTGGYYELDIWIPKLKLGFEFQDPYHYTTVWYSHTPLENLQQKDIEKQKKVESTGDTLIVVPCWWDGDQESLIASIKDRRPDLLPESCVHVPPISLLPPPDYFTPGKIPIVGELMLASFPHSESDVNKWWLGEKYDGVRCCWNPILNLLFSRSGVLIDLPHEFKSSFPSLFVDAELWYGRGSYVESQRFFHSYLHIDLSFLRAIAFDVPLHEDRNLIYEKRFTSLMDFISESHPFAIVPMRLTCLSKKHVKIFVKHIIDNNGEGVILQKPRSVYEYGRSSSLIKLKAMRNDKEAIVVAIEPESFLLRTPEDTIVKVPIQNIKMNPLPLCGDIVTFCYQNVTTYQEPINPLIIRIRTDVKWEDILHAHHTDKLYSTTTPLKESSSSVMDNKIKRNKMRLFFSNLLRSRGLDPSTTSHWYSLSPSDIYSSQGGISVWQNIKGNLVKALIYLFPELKFDSSKFKYDQRRQWKDVNNMRTTFSEFAKQRGFDPLVVANWYSVAPVNIRLLKGGRSILGNFEGSLAKVLVNIFPELHFDNSEFLYIQQRKWDSDEKLRQKMIEIAKEMNFDPHVASNWYSVSPSDVCSVKGGTLLLRRFEGSLVKALSHLFPDLHFDSSKFLNISPNHWKTDDIMRQVLIEFAEENGFDPLIASNWYSLYPSIIRLRKGGTPILHRFKGSLGKALIHLFPEISFDSSQFVSLPRKKKRELETMKRSFIDLAEKLKFDPLVASHWYSLSSSDIRSLKGFVSISNRFEGSYVKALIHLFPENNFDPSKFTYVPRHKWV